jgi:lipid-A-disaccharide synthase-like uncharacterized protein
MKLMEAVWLGVGATGQVCFTTRMLWQWIISERRKESVVTIGFWYWSLIGSMMLLAYATYRRDIVFVAGQATGAFVYLRNLALIRRASKDAVIETVSVVGEARLAG